MPTVNNTPIVFIALQPSSIAEKDSKHNNRPQKNSTYPQVENIAILPEHHFSLKNTTTCLLKRQRYRSIRIGHIFHGAFRWLFLFTIKNHLYADDYAATVCAIKSTQLKQDQTTRYVTSTQEQYPSLFSKRFRLASFAKRRSEQENVFTTNNAHQNQKINRLNQIALIFT